MNTSAETIYQVLKRGPPAARQAMVRELPPNSFQDVVISLLETERPGRVVVALSPMILSYCSGSNPAVGVTLAEAVHRYGVELFQTTTDHELLPTTLSGRGRRT